MKEEKEPDDAEPGETPEEIPRGIPGHVQLEGKNRMAGKQQHIENQDLIINTNISLRRWVLDPIWFLFWLPHSTWNYQAGDQIRAVVATYTRAAAIKDYRDSANPVVPQRELPDPILREMHASSESITHL